MKVDVSGDFFNPTVSNAVPVHLVNKPTLPLKSKTKDWGLLFKAQGPSRGMKLTHFSDIKQSGEASIELEEHQLDDKNWGHCLIGYFLNRKMALPLLSATARRVWTDCGTFKINQIGSCYFFEFQDEEAKNKVLEGEVLTSSPSAI